MTETEYLIEMLKCAKENDCYIEITKNTSDKVFTALVTDGSNMYCAYTIGEENKTILYGILSACFKNKVKASINLSYLDNNKENDIYHCVWISGGFLSNGVQYSLDVRLDGISEDEFNKVKNTDVSFRKENNDIYIQCIVDDKEINIKEAERDKWNIGEEGDMYRTSKTWKEILNKDLPTVELEEGYFILKY